MPVLSDSVHDVCVHVSFIITAPVELIFDAYDRKTIHRGVVICVFPA